jgi:hypothetical protein
MIVADSRHVHTDAIHILFSKCVLSNSVTASTVDF